MYMIRIFLANAASHKIFTAFDVVQREDHRVRPPNAFRELTGCREVGSLGKHWGAS